MKVIGILCWYDEKPSWLAGVVGGLHQADVTHLVAVDGAYAFYPGGRGYSGSEQHQTILEVCQALEIGCTIVTPPATWLGNEVEKRNHAFAVAETIAEPLEDWYFLVDADHFIASAIGLHHRLAETDADVGEVRFVERYGSLDSAYPLRCVFRAIPGLRFETNHYTYRTPDGRDLHDPLIGPVDLSMVEVEHRTRERDRDRRAAQQDYYSRRDREGVEAPDGVMA